MLVGRKISELQKRKSLKLFLPAMAIQGQNVWCEGCWSWEGGGEPQALWADGGARVCVEGDGRGGTGSAVVEQSPGCASLLRVYQVLCRE